MEVTSIVELANVLGFPAAVCVALFWLLLHVLKTHNTALQELKKSLDNNTLAIAEISRVVGKVRNDV